MELNLNQTGPNTCPHHHLVEEDPTSWMGTLLAVREVNMIVTMQKLMEKPEWFRKVHDETVCAKWMSEVMSHVDDFSELMWEYCVAELRDKAKTLEETGIVAPIDVDSQVVYSDTAISESTRKDLNRAVASLENVPDKHKDWHPKTRERVLDLVHPSLFPLVYGRSRVLKKGTVGLEDCMSYCGKGEMVETPVKPFSGGWSDQFQWLPCDVEFQGEDEIKIVSYVNNLHPKEYPDIYRLVEKVIAKAVPLWDQVLSHTGGGPYEHNEWWRENMRVLHMPEPKSYAPREVPEEPPLDLRKEYADSGLQIIVKLANTYLSPNDPEWEGGSWHVEGLSNEHIVATAIYYFSNTNITPSHLKFRQNGSDESWFDMEYEQGDYAHLEKITGFINDQDNLVQSLGSVLCKEGRLLAFPNVLQHNRKLLALFLVDPHVRILSTSKVPPQQKHWWEKDLREKREGIEKLNTLPNELMEKVFEDVQDFPISMDEAKEIREALMEERGPIGESMIECEAQFFFCEH
ncbi:hypothetical protein M438DRAFT_377976 [Aureobasidium pullulans EXF-150]|uniref:Uncharacterized protein n=1 Tax=Aureobasidium pullulans EXF-150 TaxID=1043002 RepID=A0A074XYE0_AURPU|nr:uncharacterized protein M438DRAFT_377976 [Aureobasidium pullulans EXF-150]KEQ79691.1 hypothetical protein M438DRAFT_377976 [Aureobasidium pullulans EXF-150]